MYNHPVRKIFGLIVIYALLIVGIFILQFKSESVISKNIGGMRITLAQTEDENENLVLKNQFRLTYKGITFTGDSENPVKAYSSYSRKIHELQLESFTEVNDLSVAFNFTDGSVLCFSLSDYTENAALYITSHPSQGKDQMLLTYTTDKSVKLDSQATNRVLVKNKNQQMALISSQVNLNTVHLSGTEGFASFALYDPEKHFTFDQLASYRGSDEVTYGQNIKFLREKVVTDVNLILAARNYDQLTENIVAAYIAELSYSGRYNESIASIPESYKKGSRRTYYTAPFFGNLDENYRSLAVEKESSQNRVKAALDATNADIFTVPNIADYLLKEKWQDETIRLLSFPKQMIEAEIFEVTVPQASGIIQTYTELHKEDVILASLLEKAVNYCVEMLEGHCTFEDDTFAFNEDLSFTDGIKLGQALINLGQTSGRQDYKEAGRLFVSLAMQKERANENNFSLQELAELYPLIAAENFYYPHTVILGYYGKDAVWAWTCAENISYSKDANGTANVNIKFPVNYSHYMFMEGVPSFHSQIEIQSVIFRSDPRFESYNSSGYIYNEASKVLLLKSRQRSEVELIRLFCDPSDSFISAASPITLEEE